MDDKNTLPTSEEPIQNGHPAAPTAPQQIPPQTKSQIPLCPWLPIPDRHMICIEHPAIIRNVDKGIATIGGEQALMKLAETDTASGLELRFAPENLMRPGIPSRTVPTSNLLVRIRIPKKKRKRGPDGKKLLREPEDPNETLIQKLRASEGKYEIEPVGVIDKTVRFRDMSSFQWNTSDHPTVQKLKATMFTGDFSKIKDFQISDDRGVQDTPTIPPPQFSATPIPHTYNYRQNPAIKKALIDGKTKLMNYQAGPKTLTPTFRNGDTEIPTRPDNLPPYEVLDGPTKECVDGLRTLFEQRPIWTRRALYNHFPKRLQSLVRFSMVHVGYMWRAGPWRDTCVRYDVDPRSHPDYRFYQCFFFKMDPSAKDSEMAVASDSHVFDGKRIIKDGRCFQLVDVTDPLLKGIINTESIRKKCDLHDGWYRHSTILKMKALMRAKITDITEGNIKGDTEYVKVIEAIESETEEEEAERKKREAEGRDERSKQRIQSTKIVRHSMYGTRQGGRMTPKKPPTKKKSKKQLEAEKKAEEEAERSRKERGEEDTEIREVGEQVEGENQNDDEEEEGGEDEWDQELEVPNKERTEESLMDFMVEDGAYDDGEEFEVLGEDEEEQNGDDD